MTRTPALIALLAGACTPALPELTFAEVAHDPRAAFLSAGGTGPDDVWLVGAQPSPFDGPRLLHGDGATWREVATGQLHDLWWVHAFEGGPVFVGGGGATLLRVDGDEVERQRTPGFAGQTVYGVWGASPDDVWAVGGFAGRAGFAWRYDGTSWREEPLPDDLPRAPDGEIPPLLKVWGRAADDVWLVGGQGTILHWDGTALAVVPSGSTEMLFTVHGDEREIVAVGGAAGGVVLRGGPDGFVDDTPAGAPLLQGLEVDEVGTTWVAGAEGAAWGKVRGGDWQAVDLGFDEAPQSVHALWLDGEGGLWAAGGEVLSPSLDHGVVASSSAEVTWTGIVPDPDEPFCPPGRVDIAPDGSIARRWHELLLDSVRRDIPNPPVHARNLHHVAVAMWDAWAVYDPTADGVVVTDKIEAEDPAAAREVAIAHAAYRVLAHRYADAQGGAVSLVCYADFMDLLGLDPADTLTTGDAPVAVGNRVGQAVIDAFADDGANEANGYADTTAWDPLNPVLVVDRPGTSVIDIDVWQQLNLALAETQNGIILDTTVQPYIGAHWREVEPFALTRDPVSGLYAADAGLPPSIDDPEMVDWVVEVIRKTAELEHGDGRTIDTSPASTGANTLGTNDGEGYALNPVTGEPYAPQVVPFGDFARVVAEMWADGPRSETPPGHWSKIANDVSDAMVEAGTPLVPYGEGEPVDRLAWDVALYLAVTGATHDAAIAAWELKRESLAARPISLVRYMAGFGQRSDPDQASYHPGGLPLVPGLIELITPASSAPGERHFHLRWYEGELAVRSWPGEPGDRADDFTPFQWMRALDWIPYQRRTFVTPAFPGFVSGHSTFSRAAAEALTAYTGSPWFPGGLAEFVAPTNGYLVFEDGPSVDVHLQWASYYDAADQAGQSRLWGGIHLWPDDRVGRLVGSTVGLVAVERARALREGTDR